MYQLFLNAHITTGEVASLQHKLRDDAVELATLVAVALLAGTKRSEVLSSLGNDVVIEVEVDAAFLGYDITPSAGAVASTRAVERSKEMSAVSCRSTVTS